MGNEAILKKNTLNMSPLKNVVVDLLQSVSVLQHPNEHSHEKPQKTADPAQLLTDKPSVHH